jgi:hypothetical protein
MDEDDNHSHDLTVMKDSHVMLTQVLLTKALKTIEKVLDYQIDYSGHVDDDGMPLGPDPRLEMRLLSLKAKTATATANMVIHLGDGSLRRQAGAKMDKIMEMIKEAHPDRFRPMTVIDQALFPEQD